MLYLPMFPAKKRRNIMGFLTIFLGIAVAVGLMALGIRKSKKPWRQTTGVRLGAIVALVVALSPLYVEYADGSDGYAVKFDDHGKVTAVSDFGVFCVNRCSSGLRHTWVTASVPLGAKSSNRKIIYNVKV